MQMSSAFLFGSMAGTFNLIDGSFTLPPPGTTVGVDLSWSNWPASAQQACLTIYSLSECTDIANNLGGIGNGMAQLSPDVGIMSLPYARYLPGAAGMVSSDNTYMGLTGGLSTQVAPPLPGFPFDTTQFPAVTSTGYLARIWYFVKGNYEQNMFSWVHVNIAKPCAGGSTNCGSIGFDLMNSNVFLVKVPETGALSPGAVAAPPPPAGFFEWYGCITGDGGTPSWIGFIGPVGPSDPTPYSSYTLHSVADCLNFGMANSMAYIATGVTASGTGHWCRGCYFSQLKNGQCGPVTNSIHNVSGCDAFGVQAGTNTLGTPSLSNGLYKFTLTSPSPPPNPAPPPSPPFPPASSLVADPDSVPGWGFAGTYWWPLTTNLSNTFTYVGSDANAWAGGGQPGGVNYKYMPGMTPADGTIIPWPGAGNNSLNYALFNPVAPDGGIPFEQLDYYWSRCSTGGDYGIGVTDNGYNENCANNYGVVLTGTVQQKCQKQAALVGYNTIFLQAYTYKSRFGFYVSSCWGCKDCQYFKGGAVDATNANSCSRKGCTSVGYPQPRGRMQVYKLIPSMPPPPPLPPTPSSISSPSVCAKITNRWKLTSAAVSGTTVLDSKGTWNGVAAGGLAISSAGISLDGASGYVSLGAHTVNASTSISFWAKITSLQLSYDKVFFDFAALYFSALGGGATWATASNSAYFGPAITFISPQFQPPAGVWTHYTVTLSTSQLAVYVNGVQKTVASRAFPATINFSSMTIGRGGWYGVGGFLKADFADFQLANGATLAAGEVSALYALGQTGCP